MKEVEKQMPYDPDELQKAFVESKGAEVDTGEIASVEEKEAVDIFGEDTQSDPDRPMLEITVAVGDTTFTEVMGIPQSDLALQHPDNKMGKFMERYEKAPQEGLEVDLVVDEETGFFSIDY